MEYKIETGFSKDGLIVQEVFMDHDHVRTTIMRQVMDTKEAQIKQALIKLGWTPPPNT